MSTIQLSHIDNEHDRLACFDVMRELRTHLQSAEAFVEQIRRQSAQGYRLLAAWQDNQVMALAGYRLQESLLYGRFIYVDDLVARTRSQGLGSKLMNALRDEARKLGCDHLVLDTGLGNSLAQRFYFRQGFLSKGLHFSQAL